MPARIGDPSAQYFATPDSGLLRRVTGLRPAADETHVRLDDSLGAVGIQRLALGRHGAGIWVGLWPAELKSQALYIYADDRSERVVTCALDLGWTTEPSPHLAFWNSAPAQRLYLDPDVELDEYIRRWQEEDRSWIRRRSADELTTAVWPWLHERDYAALADEPVREEFRSILGRRPFDVRPGLRLTKQWPSSSPTGEAALAVEIRQQVNTILRAAAEPLLPDRL